MGVLAYILGKSGSGKSHSMRNFTPDEITIINVEGKILPFKGSGKYNMIHTDNSADIVEEIKKAAKKTKVIVVDDFQYVMANEFMRRSAEKTYDKFTEIGRHAWDIADCVRKLPQDVIVYIMCHTDTDNEGFERLKTIGKLLDEKIVLEGMSTIVLKTAVSDGHYTFLTQNNGKDTVKSPEGMFPSLAIDNDLKYVDSKIRNYYELEGAKSDEEMAAADEAAKAEDPTAKKSRKGRRRSEDAEVQETKERNETAIANAGVTEDAKEDAVPFEDVEMPEPEEMPRRKRRGKTEETAEEPQAAEETAEEPQAEEQQAAANEAPTPRRRRRRG